MECSSYALCLDGKSRGHLGQGRKVPSATGRNLPRMHKTEKEAEESRMKFMYSYLRDITLVSPIRVVWLSQPPSFVQGDDAVMLLGVFEPSAIGLNLAQLLGLLLQKPPWPLRFVY